MTHISSAWEGPAGFATGLALLAVVAVLICVLMLIRLSRDGRTLAAAERLESVDLSVIMQRYLPPEGQTQILAQELPQAKQIVGRKTRLWRHGILVTGTFLLCAATAAMLLTRSNERRHAAEQLAKLAAPEPVDPIRAIVGVWGWKYVALQSCEANPLTMTLARNRKLLLAHFAKPVWDGKKDVSEFQYEVTGSEPNELTLSLLDAGDLVDQNGQPLRWRIKFEDADSFTMRRSDVPIDDTGQIVRCR